MASTEYKDQKQRTPLWEAPEHVRHFCERLYREMEKQKIPIRLDVLTADSDVLHMLFVTGRIPEWVAAATYGSLVVMTHLTEERELPWSVWPVLRQIANVAANGVGVVLVNDAESLVYPWLVIVEPGDTREMQADARKKFRAEERKWHDEFRKDRRDPSEKGS